MIFFVCFVKKTRINKSLIKDLVREFSIFILSIIPWEIISIGHVLMVKIGQQRGREGENGLILVGRSRNNQRGELVLHHLITSDLGICSHVISERKGREGIRAIDIIEIGTTADCVLRGVGRVALTGRERIMLEVVVAHHVLHRVNICDLCVVSLEDLSTRRLLVVIDDTLPC